MIAKNESQSFPRFDLSAESLKKTINELRALAHYYLKMNNDLVRQKWDIDIELAKIPTEPNQSELMKQEKEIDKHIKETAYSEKIETLLKAIYALEMQVYGHSDIGGSSPYFL